MKNTFSYSALIILAGLMSINTHADVIDISLNNDVAQFYYQPGGNADIETDDAGTQFGLLYNSDGDWMLSGKLIVPSANATGLQLSPGIKASIIGIDESESSVNAAISIGGRASGLLPTSLPLRAYGELYYAPSITVSNDIEDLLELEVGLEYQASNNASVYLGYRQIKIDLENKKATNLDNQFHIGIAFNF